MQDDLARYWSVPCTGQSTQYLTLLAEASVRVGDLEGARHFLDHAGTFMRDCEEHYCESELYRVHGAIARCDGSPGEATEWCEKAIAKAREQHARSLELRAATELAWLHRDSGQETAATQLLTPIYDWFKEGLQTPDLLEAKTLLDELT